MNPIHVVSVSSEMVPLAKTGGLGDVCGALPVALEAIGCRVSTFLPAYRTVMRSGLKIESTPHTFTVYIAGRHVACRVLHAKYPGSNVDVYLIDQPQYFDRDGLYNDKHGEYRDNCERFAFFCRAVVEAINQMNLPVDIVHCHDWQAALVPAYMRLRFGHFAWMERARSVMTIHNLAYQGRFWHLDMPLTGLDWKHFNWQEMEFHGDLNLMKTGIVFADAVTTVSPTYAQEITLPELGCGLDENLKNRGENLMGIVNGVDYMQWNPEHDPHLPQTYNVDSWHEGKAACKQALQRELGLDVRDNVPLVGIVSRMADQKGWDLIIPTLAEWSATRDVQWAILGTGAPEYELRLAELSKAHPTKLGVRLEFSESLAHRIEAACDMFLMPSRYEPCGLNQLYSLKYGSVPVVHATGGLADTVVDTTEASLAGGMATGFSCYEYTQSAMEAALNRAIDTFLHNGQRWAQIVVNGMQNDWSWEQSARRYVEVFERVRKFDRRQQEVT